MSSFVQKLSENEDFWIKMSAKRIQVPKGVKIKGVKTSFRAKVNIWGYFKALLTPSGHSQDYTGISVSKKI